MLLSLETLQLIKPSQTSEVHVLTLNCFFVPDMNLEKSEVYFNADLICVCVTFFSDQVQDKGQKQTDSVCSASAGIKIMFRV